ncbi:hypothetical protein [Sediminibacterium goheungense]|uniref:hypothetical protein n=1 Tax=Sediminibacterium goheungense TaxID=1086393 RepID=UPI00105BC6FA|nr:hypothetical protein [Sediminibacterium goheungense]
MMKRMNLPLSLRYTLRVSAQGGQAVLFPHPYYIHSTSAHTVLISCLFSIRDRHPFKFNIRDG